MVATENGLVYIAIPGDPLSNLATVRHFFGEDFRVHGEEVLVRAGQIFSARLKLREGVYQTYHEADGKLIPWELLSVSVSVAIYTLVISKELWCAVKSGSEHAYFPDENSRILFENYFGIR
jgi:hypothetical protein